MTLFVGEHQLILCLLIWQQDDTVIYFGFVEIENYINIQF